MYWLLLLCRLSAATHGAIAAGGNDELGSALAAEIPLPRLVGQLKPPCFSVRTIIASKPESVNTEFGGNPADGLLAG